MECWRPGVLERTGGTDRSSLQHSTTPYSTTPRTGRSFLGGVPAIKPFHLRDGRCDIPHFIRSKIFVEQQVERTIPASDRVRSGKIVRKIRFHVGPLAHDIIIMRINIDPFCGDRLSELPDVARELLARDKNRKEKRRVVVRHSRGRAHGGPFAERVAQRP